MNILITGAGGFVGGALVKRLLADTDPALRLTLIDQRFDALPSDLRARRLTGGFGEAALLREALAGGVDQAYHLASVPGGVAERDFALGQRVNLHDTLALFEALGAQARPPAVVFASTIAVYGSPLPPLVDDDTPLRPALSYGAQKLMGEIALADMSRRGMLDGRALRLPGIVARPLGSSGLISAFMSDVIRLLADGQPCILPVSPAAVAWWMSAACCVDNLLRAARMPLSPLNGSRRVWQLPALRFTLGALVETLGLMFGPDRPGLVSWQPNESVEAGFGRYPLLSTPAADAAGFKHDGNIETLVRNALR